MELANDYGFISSYLYITYDYYLKQLFPATFSHFYMKFLSNDFNLNSHMLRIKDNLNKWQTALPLISVCPKSRISRFALNID